MNVARAVVWDKSVRRSVGGGSVLARGVLTTPSVPCARRCSAHLSASEVS